ncbi:MAG: STAS domain-containing protein [bacterium]|nr:STAS domain-containing protein [bacterium]
MSMDFEIIEVSKRTGETIDYDCLIFKIKAANVMDLDNASDLWLSFKTLIEGGVLKILIDMSGLEFIDSSGIGVLINVAKLIRSKNGDIALLSVSPRINVIFKPIKLHRFINVFNTTSEAMNFFRIFV